MIPALKPSVPICMMMMIVNVSSYDGRNKMRSCINIAWHTKKKKDNIKVKAINLIHTIYQANSLFLTTILLENVN